MDNCPENTQPLVMIVYCSRILPQLAYDTITLNTTTTTILGQANSNNKKNHISGALYYGNRRFFQCLEGPEVDIRLLYNVIKEDSRHSDIKVLLSIKIPERMFGAWAMKFTASNTDILHFFNGLKIKNFYPEKLNKAQLKKFIHLLQGL